MASIYDLYVEQGSDFSQALNLVGDWTGKTIAMNVLDSTDVAHSGFVSWTDASLGELLISMTNIETSAMSNGIGKYNIEVTGAGVIDRILQGRIYVDGDV